MSLVKTIKNGDFKLEIHHHFNPENPRNWDNLTKMIFFGKRKHLGDSHDYDLGGFNDRDDFIERGAEKLSKLMDAAIIKPVHLYSHSGECISTSFEYPFNDRWDSDTIGFAVITKKDLRENYNVKKLSKQVIEKGEKNLEGEVETLNQWISGDVYGFKLFKGDEEIDSCWGFYGDDYETNGIADHLPDEWIK